MYMPGRERFFRVVFKDRGSQIRFCLCDHDKHSLIADNTTPGLRSKNIENQTSLATCAVPPRIIYEDPPWRGWLYLFPKKRKLKV
jgi:hypothetical protein